MLSRTTILAAIIGAIGLYLTITHYRLKEKDHQIAQAQVATQTRVIEQELSPIADNAIGQLHALERELTYEKEVNDAHRDSNRSSGSVSFDWMY